MESQNAALEGSLTHYLSNNSMTRVLSLRHEFSNALNRLGEAAMGTPVTFEITERHFPLIWQGRALALNAAHLVLAVADRDPIGSVSLTLNGTNVSGFSAPVASPSLNDPSAGLPMRDVAAAFATGIKGQHTLIVNDAGNLGGGTSLLDPEKLQDILLVVEYGL